MSYLRAPRILRPPHHAHISMDVVYWGILLYFSLIAFWIDDIPTKKWFNRRTQRTRKILRKSSFTLWSALVFCHRILVLLLWSPVLCPIVSGVIYLIAEGTWQIPHITGFIPMPMINGSGEEYFTAFWSPRETVTLLLTLLPSPRGQLVCKIDS